MNDHILIYLIVLLNALCQLMLIWRLQRMQNTRWLFMGIAVAVPLVAVAVMRTLVACGVINSHVVDQSHTERLITNAMSILLIAGPWLATVAAVLFNRSRRIRAMHVVEEGFRTS